MKQSTAQVKNRKDSSTKSRKNLLEPNNKDLKTKKIQNLERGLGGTKQVQV